MPPHTANQLDLHAFLRLIWLGGTFVFSNLTDFCTGAETRGGANRGNQGVFQPMTEPSNYSRILSKVRRVPLAPETGQIVSFRFEEIQNLYPQDPKF
jgi:hypothetical protein